MPKQKTVHRAASRPALHRTTRHQRKPVSTSAPSKTPLAPGVRQRLKTTPPLPSHHRHRRRTLSQRLASISGGGWAGILTGVLVLGIGIFALVTSLRSPASSIPQLNPSHGLLAVGTMAPSIGPLPAADGNEYTLAQYHGNVVVLEFFATWCPICQAETSVLKQIQYNNAAQGVQVLSVTASDDGRHTESIPQATPISMRDVQWYVSTYHLTYPALLDTSLAVGNAYGVQGYPTIYIINKQGVITYAEEGQISYESLQQHLAQAQSG